MALEVMGDSARGGEWAFARLVVEGDRIAPVLATLVQEENASTIVLGHTPVPGWRRLLGKLLVDEVMELVDNVAIQLVEVTIARDLLASREKRPKPKLPPNVQLP